MLRNLALSVALALIAVSASGQDAPLPLSRPEAQKVSSAGLARLSATLKRDIDEGRHAGIVALVARNGHIVHFEALGHLDSDAHLPMEKDTIVRIYSMSKIVTSVAVLMLMEDGRFSLDDPVERFLPALAGPRVFVGGTADAPILADAKKPVTIRHLLTHTSGYVYGGDGAFGQIWDQAKLFDSGDLDEFIQKVARLPLRRHPGELFEYGISTDILGALVQQVSGKPFGQFLEERVFAPLSMKETGFDLPDAKMGRLARTHRINANGRLVPTDEVTSAAYAEAGQGMESGGGGLFSTAGDYARFAQMLLNGGSLDGKRLLSRKTVELMTANHLTNLSKPRHAYGDSMGFGLGVEVRVDLGDSEVLGSVGVFGWSGAATTHVRIDPAERLVAIVLAQHFPMNQGGLFTRFTNACYAALE